MEELQKWIPKISKEAKIGSSSSSPLSESPFLSGTRGGGGGGGGGGVSAALSSSNQSHVLVTRAPRYFHYYTLSLFLVLSDLVYFVNVVFIFIFHLRIWDLGI